MKNQKRPGRPKVRSAVVLADKSSNSADTKHTSIPRYNRIASGQDADLNTQCMKMSHHEEVNSREDEKENDIDELLSSPIKRSSYESPLQSRYLESSSPIRKKKTVAFSDELLSDMPSSPDKFSTPKRSILKPTHGGCNQLIDPNNTALWSKQSGNGRDLYWPGNNNFWLQGTVIQLPHGSPELPQLIQGCLRVLSDESFNKRFEVYATLNSLNKSENEALRKIFGASRQIINGKTQVFQPTVRYSDNNIVSELTSYIRKDIIKYESILFPAEIEKENQRSKSKNDPFSIRVISQALRLIGNFISDPELNLLIPADDIKWFFLHSCSTIVTTTTSKALVASYLGIIKEYNFSIKKKRIVFENSDLPERILFSLLNMKSFPSPSILTERFISIRNLVQTFPSMMSKNFRHWFGLLLINVCSLTSQAYYKCMAIGSLVLLEISKHFLDNKNAMLQVDSFLESNLPKNFKSFFSEGSIFEADLDILAMEYVNSGLRTMINNGQSKPAMEIWMAITLLCNSGNSGFEAWCFLSRWMEIQNACFQGHGNSAKLLAITSFKTVVYRVCHNDLSNTQKFFDTQLQGGKQKSQIINNTFKPKVRLLTHAILNVSEIEDQKDLIDGLHDLFLCIIYTLVNPMSQKSSTKYMHIYWDRILQPVLMFFYFKRGSSSPYMNNLGFNLLTKLLKNSTASLGKSHNEFRCLSSEPISLNELAPLPSRWIYNHFDKLIPCVTVILQLELIFVEQKVELITELLNTIKLSTKKEIKVSQSTFDIIDSMPIILDVLFKHSNVSSEATSKLVISLRETFDSSSLVRHTNRSGYTSSSYLTIIENYNIKVGDDQLKELLDLILSGLAKADSMALLQDLTKLFKETKESESSHKLKMIVNFISVVTETDFETCKDISGILDNESEDIAKKLIEFATAKSNVDEASKLLKSLDVHTWSLRMFEYYISLSHNMLCELLKAHTNSLMKQKLENYDSFVYFFKFLIYNRYDSEILALVGDIIRKLNDIQGFHRFEISQIWKDYLSNLLKSDNFEILDNVLVVTYEQSEIDVKPYVRNNWAKLPSLKRCWLDRNSELHIDKALSSFQESEHKKETGESSTNVLSKFCNSRPRGRPKGRLSRRRKANSDSSSIPAQEYKSKTKTSSEDYEGYQQENKGLDSNELCNDRERESHNFNLHSFTALVTSKLSSVVDQSIDQSDAKTKIPANTIYDNSLQSPRENSAIHTSEEYSISNDVENSFNLKKDTKKANSESLLENRNTLDKRKFLESEGDMSIPKKAKVSERIDEFQKYENSNGDSSPRSESDIGSYESNGLMTPNDSMDEENAFSRRIQSSFLMTDKNDGSMTSLESLLDGSISPDEADGFQETGSIISLNDGSPQTAKPSKHTKKRPNHYTITELRTSPEKSKLIENSPKSSLSKENLLLRSTNLSSQFSTSSKESSESNDNVVSLVTSTSKDCPELVREAPLKSLSERGDFGLISSILDAILDEEISKLTADEKHQLETRLMQLMLRMRSIPPQS
ncbi:uncharacterized protein PRCAT00004441001 [Priceomyces carsonii]|uniref:uncharacterized protein n=1 Tax=Priceomyces carsonii TaxID=28549 RepID=UPI002ED77EB3|nr:unnamed protein product [Priceomyces carsonii]